MLILKLRPVRVKFPASFLLSLKLAPQGLLAHSILGFVFIVNSFPSILNVILLSLGDKDKVKKFCSGVQDEWWSHWVEVKCSRNQGAVMA